MLNPQCTVATGMYCTIMCTHVRTHAHTHTPGVLWQWMCATCFSMFSVNTYFRDSLECEESTVFLHTSHHVEIKSEVWQYLLDTVIARHDDLASLGYSVYILHQK